MFCSSVQAKDDITELTVMLKQNAKFLFGVNPDGLGTEFFKGCSFLIVKKFQNITIQDVRNAFESCVIEKEKYQSLTRDELIKPIKDYWTKKNMVVIEIGTAFTKEFRKPESELNMVAFILSAENVYLAGLKTGKWGGTDFQAHSIAFRFKDRLDKDLKAEIWILAQKEYRERFRVKSLATGLKAIEPIPTPERMFSRMVLEKCLEMKIKLPE